MPDHSLTTDFQIEKLIAEFNLRCDFCTLLTPKIAFFNFTTKLHNPTTELKKKAKHNMYFTHKTYSHNDTFVHLDGEGPFLLWFVWAPGCGCPTRLKFQKANTRLSWPASKNGFLQTEVNDKIVNISLTNQCSKVFKININPVK